MEDALEQSGLSLRQPRWEGWGVSACTGAAAFASVEALGIIAGRSFSRGREHAVETDEMQLGTGDERGEALQELERFHHDMGGAIEVKGF